MDECAAGTDECVCAPDLVSCNVHCSNIDGSYICGCSAGYDVQADGLTCIGEYPTCGQTY